MKKQKGFTLIELLVVIAIIGVLSTLAVVALNSARAKSRDAKRISDIKQMQTALEMYFNEHGTYPDAGVPDAANPGRFALNSVTTSNSYSFTTSSTNPTNLMEKIPMAPIAESNCAAADNTYTYRALSSLNPVTLAASGNASTYAINFCLGSGTGGLSSGRATATPAGIAQ